MAPRKTLTAADLERVGIPSAPPAPPAGAVPVDPRDIDPPSVVYIPAAPADPVCAAPRAHAGCLFGADPLPTCVAPASVRRSCPYGRTP